MKRRQTLVCGILAAVLALAFTACPGPSQVEPGTGSVAGTVVFPEGEDGIVITLTLEAAAGQFSLDYVVTDETGGGVPFRFDDVPPGIHALFASWQSTQESDPVRGFVRNVEVRAGIVYPLGNIIINLGCGCAPGNVSCTCTHGNVPGCNCDPVDLGCNCTPGAGNCACTHGNVGCGCAPGNVSCSCTHGNVPGCNCDLADLGCNCTPGAGNCGCTHGNVSCSCTPGNVPGCNCDPADLGCNCTPGAGNCGCAPGNVSCSCTNGNVPGCTCNLADLGCGCTHGNVGCGCAPGNVSCTCTHGNVPGCTCNLADLGCGCTHGNAGCDCEQSVAAITIVSNGVGVTAIDLVPGHSRVLYARCPGGNALSNVLWFSTNPGIVSVQRPEGRSMLESGETVRITVADGAALGDTAIIRATSLGGVGGNLVEAALLVTVTNFVRVEGGTFQMGSCSISPVHPIRSVTVSGFYMSRFQVTQGEWYDMMGTWPSSRFTGTNAFDFDGTTWNLVSVTPAFDRRNLPVESVSWYYALVFSNRLSMQSGLTPAYSIGGSTNPDDWGPVPTSRNLAWDNVEIVPGSTGYRLPTEAQWEFAARGGIVCQGNYVFSGSNTAADVAWYAGRRTHEVGTRQPNALGLYDMTGNVSEWVWDWWGPYPDFAETDPMGGASWGFERVGRGGSWGHSSEAVRSVFRLRVIPYFSEINVGFRLVRP